MQTLKDKVQGRGRGTSCHCGFTLTELIAVMAIISMLAAILVPALRFARREAREARARAMIVSLRLAISMFETDTGSIPGLGNPSPPSIHRQLTTSAGWAAPAGWAGPYMEFRAEDLSGETIIDPWDAAYQFSATAPIGAPLGHAVYIWSLGPTAAAGDNVTSWE